jgi:carboxypeptidase family protein/TonB-dependent receptor-like protein
MLSIRGVPIPFTARSLAVLALIASVPSAPLGAQTAVTAAAVSGRVSDPSGALMPGVRVTATSRERGQSFGTETDAQGRFRFLYLPVDSYTIVFERPPFAAATRAVTLTVGESLDVSVRLALPQVTQSVEVVVDLPMVETVRSQVAETITPHEVSSLPLNGRNYLDLAALSPGVTRSNPVGNQRFPETSAVPGTGLSVTGQRQIDNGFVVDGLSANDDAADLPGTFFSEEVIREFQVVTSGGIAEYGRASGGIVNVLTRSGTNTWRGDAYGFLRDDALDAKSPLAATRDPLRQWQYGASVGGPLVPDRTFLFGNVEQTRLHSATVVTIRPGDAAAINARLGATSYPGPRVETGLATTGYDSTNVFLKLDHRLSPNALLAARYSLYDISSPNARSVGGLNAVSRGTALEDTDQTLAASLLLTLSPRAVNETRAQYTRSRLAAPANDLTGPAVNIAGVASLGTATSSPTARDLDLYEVTNVTTLERGTHALRGGLDLLWNRADIAFPGALQGVYAFSSLADFQAGRYSTFQQAFGAPGQFQSNPNLGVFAQDEWRVRRSLTLNLGLRYDLQFLPDPVRTDTGNVSPRLGLAWAPGSGATVVRANWGRFYERIPLRATSNALQRDGSKYRVAVVPLGTPDAPAFPGVLSAFPSGLLASITTIDPDIQNARTSQASVQVERALGTDASAAVGFLRVRGQGLILTHNVNVPTLTAAEAAARGIGNLGRPDPQWANISRYESAGTSSYDGITLSLRRRLAGWASGRVSYTWSKAYDDAGNAFFFSPQDNVDIHGEWGPSDNDQRHRLVVSGTAEVRKNLRLAGVLSYGSALPYNVTTGGDRNNDTNNNDRPIGVGRNSGRGFAFASLDLRVSRVFAVRSRARVEAIVEGFNVLNRANLQLPNGVFGPGPAPRASFGQATGAADPRQIQFGLRASF